MATPSPRRVFFLRTLGTLSIEGGADSGRSRRALALLALIAAEGPTGVDRDRVLAFFWPNSDAERAANSFRQINASEAAQYNKPQRIRIVTVKSGDTVQSLSSRMVVADEKEGWFRVLNGLTDSQQVQPGQKVKLVTY